MVPELLFGVCLPSKVPHISERSGSDKGAPVYSSGDLSAQVTCPMSPGNASGRANKREREPGPESLARAGSSPRGVSG